MNSRTEWTVSRETMSFYGVAHDRLPRVVADREIAVRATVSTSFVPAEADHQIGVWCVPPVTTPACRKPQPETIAQSKSRFGPSFLAGSRDSRTLTQTGAWINVYSRVHGGESKKPENKRDKECMLS